MNPYHENPVLTAEQVEALELDIFAVASSALEGLVSTPCAAQNVASQIHIVARRAIARAFKNFNTVLTVHRLPDEVFGDIFSHIPFRSLVVASSVCTRWRLVALNTAVLWNSITVTASTNPAFLDLLLSRSKSAALYLSITVAMNRYLGMVERLQTHGHRTRSLEVIASETNLEDLKSPTTFPHLERLRVALESARPGTPLQFINAPRLTDLALIFTTSTSSKFGLLDDLLDQCPALRRLYIHVAKHASVNLVLSRPIKSVTPQLEDIRIVAKLETIISVIPFIHGCRHVSVGGHDILYAEVPMLPALLADFGPIDSVALLDINPQHDAWQGGRERCLFRSGTRTCGVMQYLRKCTIQSLAAHADTLVSLTLYEENVRISPPFPHLPALRTFTAIAPTMEYFYGQWNLPALECLCIGNYYPHMNPHVQEWQWRYSLDLPDVTRFVRDVAGVTTGVTTVRGERQLSRLVLVNVDLDDVPDVNCMERALAPLARQVHILRDRQWDGLAV